MGRGTVISRREERRGEGATVEASCYTDPLALDHLTGCWRRAVEYLGAGDAPVTTWMEGGTSRLEDRLAALRRLAAPPRSAAFPAST